MSEAEIMSVNTAAEVERTPQGTVRRWSAELGIAEREEKPWRDEVKKLWELYEGGRKKAHAFNIFWANTETLAPAVYNSTPQPDVRRRFRDRDPLGKAVSQVMERAVSYEIDAYDFDAQIESAVLDMLVTGRGVARIKYEPRFAPLEPAVGDEDADPQERLAGQSVECECVQWDDFRRGPGKRWEDVPWVAFRHQFTEEMAGDKFGPELAAKLTYTEGADHEAISDDKQTREIFKTVEVWEIWDRDQRRVLFVSTGYKDAPLLEADDPLKLKSFYPCPRPAYAVYNTRSLLPVPLYRLYEEQAKELDRVSARINKITNAIKVRGAYSSNLTEMASILTGDDGEMVAVQNVSEIASIGGLDKAIWIMPIDKLQAALRELYTSREQIKATIYEITGLSDILRGSTDPNETASAQQLKSQWGSVRLQKLQRAAQRLARDIIRLKAEVIAEQYTPETLAAITNLQFPQAAQKQQAQQFAMQAQQMGQPVPSEVAKVLETPSWDEIVAVLHSDKLREYKIDVETNSTVQETIDRDMQGMSEIVTAVGGVIASVQTGVPPEVAREVALAMVRRARMGNAVEDAIDQFQPQQANATAEAENVKAQIMDIIKQAGAKQVQADQAAQQQQVQQQQVAEAVPAIAQAIPQVMQAGEQAVMGVQELAQRQDQQAQMLAQIGQMLQQMQAGQGQALEGALGQVAQAFDGVVSSLQQVAQGMQSVMETVSRPKSVRIERDADGKIVGAAAETVQ